MTCELVDFLVTVCEENFVLTLLDQSTFFKGMSNICKKTSYQQLKQKIIEIFLSIAGRLKRDSLNHKTNSQALK